MNIHFFIMLIISSIVFLADILIYTFKLNYWIAIAIGTSICGIVIFINRKNLKLRTDCEKLDIICFILIFCLSFIRFFQYDNYFDTVHYHIYMQENPFTDKINFDFFPGRVVTSFTYPLGDRMHFLMRNILGYRLGNILTVYSLIILYYQAKELIKFITNSDSKLVTILANMAYMIGIILEFLCKYYVDIFSTIFIMQVILMLFKSDNFVKEKNTLYMSFLISGIATRS